MYNLAFGLVWKQYMVDRSMMQTQPRNLISTRAPEGRTKCIEQTPRNADFTGFVYQGSILIIECEISNASIISG